MKQKFRKATGLEMLQRMFPPPDMKFVEEFDKELRETWMRVMKQLPRLKSKLRDEILEKRKEVITMACKKCAKAKPAPKKAAAKPCKGKCKK